MSSHCARLILVLAVTVGLGCGWLTWSAVAGDTLPGAFSTKFSQKEPEHFLTVADIAQTPDRGYLLAGEVTDNTSITASAWLAKVDRNGKRSWERELGKTTLSSALYRILALPDGFVLLGIINDGLGGASRAAQGWVISMSASGKVRWERYLGDGRSERVFPSKVIRLPTGELVVLGRRMRGQESSPFVMKLREDGQDVSEAVFPATEVYAVGMDGGFVPGSLDLLADRGLLEAGSEMFRDRPREARLTRFGPDGKRVWTRQFIGIDGRTVARVSVLADSAVLIGLEAGPIGHPRSTALAVIDKAGELVWEKPVNARGACSIRALWTDGTGEIVASGATCDSERDRVWVAKFTAAGELLAFRTLVARPGGYVRPILFEPGLRALLVAARRATSQETVFLRQPFTFGP
jgi:hypothetical protein